MLAIETAPTLHPARVQATDGAGALTPFAVIMYGQLSFVALMMSVQYWKEEVKKGLPVTVSVNTGFGGNDVVRRMRLERRMVIRHQRAIVGDEIQQVGHQLEIGWDIQIIACEVDVIELDVDHMLDIAMDRL